MASASPTPEQVKAVQDNILKLQRINDHIHNASSNKVLNAYLKLSEQDNSDLGLSMVLNMLESMFWSAGAVVSTEIPALSGIANFLASFCSGLVAEFSTDTPESLNQAFSDLIGRLDATFEAFDDQMGIYGGDVAGNWNKTFTFNGKTSALSDLATMEVPVENIGTGFGTITAAGIRAMDQFIWQTILQKSYMITYWTGGGNSVMTDMSAQQMTDWDAQFLNTHSYCYYTWVWHEKSGCGDSTGWLFSKYTLGTEEAGGYINADACNYLFIDTADGVVVNSAGLFTRKQVFTSLGIQQYTYTIPDSVGAAKSTTLSTGYLRAMKEGNTLGKLIEREGRESVEKRIIEEAHKNPFFAHTLSQQPRETLEEFLGVKIPDIVTINVTVETARTFGLTIPARPLE